jgi:hypothetical protein
MKLYILYESIPYEGGYVFGIFSTPEKVQEVRDTMMNNPRGILDVATCELDESIDGSGLSI